MNSALYFGRVQHRRNEPFDHAFEYGLFLVGLDLDELDSVFADRWLWSTRRPALAWFRRADFHGDASVPLDRAVRDTVLSEIGRRPEGRIVLFTQLRLLGLSFNPVSFYYCFDREGRLDAIAAEITNTPWLQRHTYVVDARAAGAGPLRFRFAKRFHVSPFLAMDCEYDWTFGAPGAAVVVHMENRRDGRTVFDATMRLERREIGAKSLALALIAHPCSVARVVLAIYWQALVLRIKGAPFHENPARSGVHPAKPADRRSPAEVDT